MELIISFTSVFLAANIARTFPQPKIISVILSDVREHHLYALGFLFNKLTKIDRKCNAASQNV